MNLRRRSHQIYLLVALSYVVLLGWWILFFAREGDRLVAKAESAGAPLDAAQARAVRDAVAGTLRMFAFEGGFLVLILLVGWYLVLRAKRREGELLRKQREFLSAVTHELRSPIASAKLYLESILLGRAEGEKHGRYVRHAHEDLERLDSMVGNLLESARVSNEKLDVRPEELDLAAFVADMQHELEREFGMRGAEVEFDLREPVRVIADAKALETILRNLVSNAVKYGGERPRVQIAARSEDGRGVLAVRDFGPGLQGADRRIFEAFERGPSPAVRARPGVGLGLFLVAELTRAQNGSISATDDLPGGGTLLRLSLPGLGAAS
jgi:signal transduction histidine kinase